MYIYIYRILLNKFVWYTLAIYTTVSPSDGNFRPSAFPSLHIFQLYTEKKKETDKERRGEGRGEKKQFLRE